MKGVSNRKSCSQLHLFGKSIVLGFFHVLENCQHHLLYWPQRPKLFFFYHGLSFRRRPVNDKPMFCLFVNIFDRNMLLNTLQIFFYKFYIIRVSSPPKKLMTTLYSSLKLDLSLFWIGSKQNEIKIIFAMNQFQIMQNVHFWKRWRKNILLFSKTNPLWMTIVYIYKYIYISKVGDRSRGWSEAPFSIATKRRCRWGRYSFPWISPLDP